MNYKKFDTIKIIIHIAVGYNVVSNSFICGHAGGGFASYCSKLNVANCADECTPLNDCMGYGEDTRPNAPYCYLYPTSNQCPSGFRFVGIGKNVVNSNDLIELSSTSGTCMSKKGTISLGG